MAVFDTSVALSNIAALFSSLAAADAFFFMASMASMASVYRLMASWRFPYAYIHMDINIQKYSTC